jgi:hypothetical protein
MVDFRPTTFYYRFMIPRPFRRLAALVLAVSFVGGGFGLADLDALLYHSQRADDPQQPHYDQPGGCGSHAEHCVLAAPVSLRHAAGAPTAPAITTRAIEPLPLPEPARTPRPADRVNLQPTRAPPAS